MTQKLNALRALSISWGGAAAFVVSALTAVSMLVAVPRWIERTEGRLTAVEEDNQKHHDNKSEHMPYDQKVREFVMRTEWHEWKVEADRQRTEMRVSQQRIEDRVEKIYDILTEPRTEAK